MIEKLRNGDGCLLIDRIYFYESDMKKPISLLIFSQKRIALHCRKYTRIEMVHFITFKRGIHFSTKTLISYVDWIPLLERNANECS